MATSMCPRPGPRVILLLWVCSQAGVADPNVSLVTPGQITALR
jgi:hypothetical protein